jgi:uncharacterized membrane protein YdjX (TVP38/TMEM64 family)
MTNYFKLKLNSKFIFLCLYVIILLILYKLKLIPKDLQSLKNIVISNPDFSMLTFMILSTLRIFVFIPGAAFCILGGLILPPFKAVLLSFTAYLLSFSLIFFIGKYLFSDKLTKWIYKNNPYLYKLLKDYGIKAFTVGLLCPIAPGDLLCLLLSSLDISFFRYLVITGLTHLPWVIIYSFLGYSFHMSLLNMILFILVLLLIILFSIKSWNRLKA